MVEVKESSWKLCSEPFGKVVACNLEIAGKVKYLQVYRWSKTDREFQKGKKERAMREGERGLFRSYVRLNERNVNHKKLRAFKSSTRWRTFALITWHPSFYPLWLLHVLRRRKSLCCPQLLTLSLYITLIWIPEGRRTSPSATQLLSISPLFNFFPSSPVSFYHNEISYIFQIDHL